MVDETERELVMTVRVRTFGSRRQAKATAHRIASMLSVELHQDVCVSRVEYWEVKK